MIQNRQDLLHYLRADRFSRQIRSPIYSFFLDPLFRFNVYLRINEYLLNRGTPRLLRLLPLFLFKRLSIRLGFSVPLNVFGPGLGIIHYGLLVVNPASRIGKNCRIHAGVNIGGTAGLRTAEEAALLAPTLGDNCYIGPGAKIFGPVQLGNNCVIGANAVVNKSFPDDNLTLGGIPAQIIKKQGSQGLVPIYEEPSRSQTSP